MRSKSIAYLIIPIAFISCGAPEKTAPHCHASWEFIPGNMKDTVNKTDCEGLKQGKWMPSRSNKLTDTLFYKNDTIINS